MKKRFAKCILAGLVAAISPALTACNAPNANADNAQRAAPEAVPSKPAVVFDVPALIGKNMKEIEQALGPADAAAPPTEEEQRLVGFEWKKTFTKGDYQLITKYDGDTKKANAFTVTMKKGARGSGNPHELDEIANVNAGATQYYITMEPVPGSKSEAPNADPNAPPVLPAFMGITIVPVSDSTGTATPNK